MQADIPREAQKKGGIYKIVNMSNGKVYVGSTKSFRIRFNKHYFGLETQSHPNKHLLNSYQKHGKHSFCFTVVAIIDSVKDEPPQNYSLRLLEAENREIVRLKSNISSFGYNARISAESNFGIKHSPNARTRIKGKTLSNETRRKMSLSRQGEKHHSAKLSELQVKEIKILITLGYRNTNIAKLLGVSKSIINDIKNNGAWSETKITNEEIKDYSPPTITESELTRLDLEKVKALKYLLFKGINKSLISEITSTKYSRIKDISSGKTYNQVKLTPQDIIRYESLFSLTILNDAKDELNRKNNLNRKAAARLGSKNSFSVLNEDSVLQIVGYLETHSVIEIASIFKISVHAINKIKSGDNWSHLTGIVKNRTGKRVGENHPNTKYGNDTVLRIIELTGQGYSTKQICSFLQLEKTFVNRVKSAKTRTDITGLIPE